MVGSLFSRYFWLDIWTNFLRVFLANNRETNKRAIVLQADARERERESDIYIYTHTCSEKSHQMEIYHEFVQKSYGNNIGQHLKPK